MSPRYWPALVIALLVASYWARVLKLVYKTYKTTGKSAGFVPREPLGRALRVVWFPAVVAWFVVPAVIAYRPNVAPGFRLLLDPPLLPIVAWIGVATAIAAFLATLVCWKKMGTSWRMGIDPGEKTQLIVTGPYAYVRHPIYALSSLLMIASVLAAPVLVMIAVAIIHLLFLQWEARREEKYLVRTHGPEYENYLRRVGRFVPRSLGGFNR